MMCKVFFSCLQFPKVQELELSGWEDSAMQMSRRDAECVLCSGWLWQDIATALEVTDVERIQA